MIFDPISIEISSDWVRQHPTLASWVLGAVATAVLTGAGWFVRLVVLGFTNHLPHIQQYTGATKNSVERIAIEQEKTNAKLDVLIEVMKRN